METILAARGLDSGLAERSTRSAPSTPCIACSYGDGRGAPPVPRGICALPVKTFVDLTLGVIVATFAILPEEGGIGGLLVCVTGYLDAGNGCWFEACYGESRGTPCPLDVLQGSLDGSRELKGVYLLAQCEQILYGLGQGAAGGIGGNQPV